MGGVIILQASATAARLDLIVVFLSPIKVGVSVLTFYFVLLRPVKSFCQLFVAQFDPFNFTRTSSCSLLLPIMRYCTNQLELCLCGVQREVGMRGGVQENGWGAD